MLLRVYSTRVQATIRRIKNNNTRNNNNNNNTRPDQIFPLLVNDANTFSDLSLSLYHLLFIVDYTVPITLLLIFCPRSPEFLLFPQTNRAFKRSIVNIICSLSTKQFDRSPKEVCSNFSVHSYRERTLESAGLSRFRFF